MGSVEQNPGPNKHETDYSISICNINTRSLRNEIEFIHDFAEEFDIVKVTVTH